MLVDNIVIIEVGRLVEETTALEANLTVTTEAGKRTDKRRVYRQDF